jgi:hypothetical protein
LDHFRRNVIRLRKNGKLFDRIDTVPALVFIFTKPISNQTVTIYSAYSDLQKPLKGQNQLISKKNQVFWFQKGSFPVSNPFG